MAKKRQAKLKTPAQRLYLAHEDDLDKIDSMISILGFAVGEILRARLIREPPQEDTSHEDEFNTQITPPWTMPSARWICHGGGPTSEFHEGRVETSGPLFWAPAVDQRACRKLASTQETIRLSRRNDFRDSDKIALKTQAAITCGITPACDQEPRQMVAHARRKLKAQSK